MTNPSVQYSVHLPTDASQFDDDKLELRILIERNFIQPILQTEHNASPVVIHTLSHALDELIKNAIDAHATILRLSYTKTDNVAILAIQDNGDGFPKKMLQDQSSIDYSQVINGKSNYQSEKSQDSSQLGGHGRGLAQTHELLQEFNGSIVLSSKKSERGATIELISATTPVQSEVVTHHFNQILDRHKRKLSIISAPVTSGTTELVLQALRTFDPEHSPIKKRRALKALGLTVAHDTDMIGSTCSLSTHSPTTSHDTDIHSIASMSTNATPLSETSSDDMHSPQRNDRLSF